MKKQLGSKGGFSRKLISLAVAAAMMVGSAVSVSAEEYVVQQGDYLVKIAEKYDTTWRILADYNKLKNPSLIYPNQIINIPDELSTAVPAAPPAPSAPVPTEGYVVPVQTSAPVEEPVATESGMIDLTILGTSDLHGNVWGYSYEDQKDTTNNGFARVASYIDEVKAENENVILVDNGDTIQGTILTDDLYNKKYLDEVHPMIKVMNELGYSSMVVGNHEFNFGLDLIAKLQKDAKFPILGGNAKYAADGSDFLDGYTVIEEAGLKIGIIGLVTPNIPRWDGEKVDALRFDGLGETAAKYAKILKEEEKVDLIIATVHAGLPAEYDEDGLSDAASQVPVLAPEIDVMLIGHLHVVVKDQIGDTIVGAPRNSGRDVVRFDLTIDTSGDEIKIVDKTVDVVDMANYKPSEAIRELTKTEHQNTLDFINGGGAGGDGEKTGGIFGVATADFQPVNEINGIPEGKLRDTAVVEFINKVQLYYSGADVSASALFKDTSDLKKGDITYGNIFDIYKFDNTLYVVEVTGAELKNYMEWSAACYNQWKQGDVSISFDPEKPGYLYDMFEGVDYKIDLSQPAGSRIKDVKFKGEDLRDDQIIKLCVNNYRYSSALIANKMIEGKRSWESPGSIRDYLVQYIAENGEITPEVNNNWEIIGVDLESPYRAEIIEKVNKGEIEIPYAKSLNVNDLIKEGVIKEK